MTAKDNSVHSPFVDATGQPPADPSETNEQQLQPPDYIASTIQENETSDASTRVVTQTDDASKIVDVHRCETHACFSRRLVYDENGQIQFPLNTLIKLEEQLNQTRWVVPVLPDGELIKCLRAAVRLATLSKL